MLNSVNLLNYFGEVDMVDMNSGGKCPLLKDKCLGEVCAWWISEEEMCAISSAARAFNTQKKIFS